MTNEFPRGFSYFPDFLSHDEEQEVLKQFKALEWQKIIMYGVTAKRTVIHYGLGYEFKNRRLTKTPAIPEFLEFIVQRAAPLLQVPEQELVELLISRYPVGAGIGWHKDAPVFDKIFGISLASSCFLNFRSVDKKQVIKQMLIPGSAYILDLLARSQWQHCIRPVKQVRYSITVRSLRKKNNPL